MPSSNRDSAIRRLLDGSGARRLIALGNDRRFLGLVAAVLLILAVMSLGSTPDTDPVATTDDPGFQDLESFDEGTDPSEVGGPGATQDPSGRGAGPNQPGGSAGEPAVIPEDYKGEVGVTDNSIRIGAIYPQSGAFAAFTTQYAKVWRAAFNDVNDREGGIYGRRLILETVDEGESSSQALAATRQIAPKVFGYTTFLQETVEANFAEANRVPALTLLGNITPGAVNGKYRYSFQVGTPPGYYMARNGPSFIRAKFPNLVDKTVFVTGEIYPSAEEAFTKAAKRHGVNVLHTETLAINQAQCLNSVQNVSDHEPEIVFVIAGPIEAGCFFRDAKAVGFQPQFATLLNIPQNAASGGADNQVPGIVPYFPLESEEGRRMIATYKRYHPNEEVTFAANDRAWASAQMWIQWIRAIGPGPTRKAFPTVVETNGPYENGFDGPQKFSREIHVGSEHTIAGFQAGGGRYEITDTTWRTTYDGIVDPPFFPFRK